MTMSMVWLAVFLPSVMLTTVNASFQPIPSFSTATTTTTMAVSASIRSRCNRSGIVVNTKHGGAPLGATSNDHNNDTESGMQNLPISITTTAATTKAPPPVSSVSRRSIITAAAATTTAFILGPSIATTIVAPSAAHAVASTTKEDSNSMYAPKFVQTYDDFITMPEGWSYKDVKLGRRRSGGSSNVDDMNEVEWKDGDRVVFDWSGYTIGYFGRPFEAKGGPQGGAFDKEINYFRTVLGSHTIIPGLEHALRSMKVGGIRQVIVPYGSLSYPSNTDFEHDVVGPKPTTFSGMRALNFVLENERVDRTLLFNVKLIRVDRSDGRGGFIRGDGPI